jgi:hypothetical protein
MHCIVECCVVIWNLKEPLGSGFLNISDSESCWLWFFERKSESNHRWSQLFQNRLEPAVFVKELLKNQWVSGWLLDLFSF